MSSSVAQGALITSSLDDYRYVWPDGEAWRAGSAWRIRDSSVYVRELPECAEELAADSRWPAFFPSSMCFVTVCDGLTTALEKVVGASIVNRFPYVLALSFCRDDLSARHHPRTRFMQLLEQSGRVAVQFLPPGDPLNRAMAAIASTTDRDTTARVDRSGLATHKAVTNDAPVFDQSYLVYEARLAKPARDLEGHLIYDRPWLDVGSHRVFFLEIQAIQLRKDIATGQSQIHWRSLPAWRPDGDFESSHHSNGRKKMTGQYQKPYTPHYAFPSANTIAFESDEIIGGMAVKYIPSLASDQIEGDNDRARWPCFFPSSVGMITSQSEDGTPNLMPCGSTTILSRHPLVVAPCVSYSAINERYSRRASLDLIRRKGTFVCGVPFIHDQVLNAIRYAGNVSLKHNSQKVADSGLRVDTAEYGPTLPDLPVQFECRVTGEVRLGTHVMFLGEVCRIRVRPDVTRQNPLEWCPWPMVRSASGQVLDVSMPRTVNASESV